MKENYTLVLRSQTATNRIGSLVRNYQYNVNWSAILPKPQDINQKYQVRFSFICLAQSSIVTETYYLSIDFGGSNMYDQANSKSTYLGYIYPMANTNMGSFLGGVTGLYTTLGYSIAKLTDNVPVTIEYPNNSLIIVNLVNSNDLGGAPFTNQYTLTLEFIPV